MPLTDSSNKYLEVIPLSLSTITLVYNNKRVYLPLQFIVAVIIAQSLSHFRLFVTPWTATCQTSRSFTISWNLLKLMSIGLMMPSNYLIFCCPFLLLPSIFERTKRGKRRVSGLETHFGSLNDCKILLRWTLFLK